MALHYWGNKLIVACGRNHLVVAATALLAYAAFAHKACKRFVAGNRHRIDDSLYVDKGCPGIRELNAVVEHLDHRARATLGEVLVNEAVCEQFTNRDLGKGRLLLAHPTVQLLNLISNGHHLPGNIVKGEHIASRKVPFALSVASPRHPLN